MPSTVRRGSRDGVLLFHAPCFDGAVSAVLAHDFLRRRAGWTGIALEGVNYDAARGWLRRRLKPHTAIVDFLYHPQAHFWADHHATTFLGASVRAHRQRRNRSRWLVYDVTAPSCAQLLQQHLERAFGHRTHAFDELVAWATKIDSADYATPSEAMSMDSPALRISLSLAANGPGGFPEKLVALLLERDLAAVARHPEVARRADRAWKRLQVGLDRLKASAEMAGDIVVFDVHAAKAAVPRYGPYLFFPDAKYSVGVVRSKGEAKVTAMRNPWRTFESVPLGGVMARHGGGGHHRVASVVLKGPRARNASDVLRAVVDEIGRR